MAKLALAFEFHFSQLPSNLLGVVAKVRLTYLARLRPLTNASIFAKVEQLRQPFIPLS